jgi:hypothetical protein
MVEDGLVTAADFRDFTFAEVVRLFGRQNSRFFAGTCVAAYSLLPAPAKVP